MAEPAQRMVVAHFIVSDDVERSRRFYTEVLGGTLVFGPEPTYVALANGVIIINRGGHPPTTSPGSPSRRQGTPTGSAAFSTSAWRTSTLRTRNGAGGARSSSRRPSSTSTRSVATSKIPTATSSRSGKPPTHKETGGRPTGHRSNRRGNPTELPSLAVHERSARTGPEGSAGITMTGSGRRSRSWVALSCCRPAAAAWRGPLAARSAGLSLRCVPDLSVRDQDSGRQPLASVVWPTSIM